MFDLKIGYLVTLWGKVVGKVKFNLWLVRSFDLKNMSFKSSVLVFQKGSNSQQEPFKRYLYLEYQSYLEIY